jgi:plastocyanin
MYVRLVALGLAVLAGFAISAVSAIGAAPAGAATVSLSVHDFAFSPTPLTVPAGATVTVTNSGATAHTWSSDPGAAKQWSSGNIAPGASFSVTFSQAGTFTYHCNIHPFMTGTIVVTASAPATTSPPATTPTTSSVTASPATTPVAGATVAPSAVAATPTPRATALPRTGASQSGLLVGSAAAITLVGIGLAASGARRRRRIS